MDSASLRKWITWSMVGILLLSVVYWFATRGRIPSEVRIATGRPGGEYFAFGTLLGSILERRNDDVKTSVVDTEGSRNNVEGLMAHAVELAVLQGGSVDWSGYDESDKPVMIAPLFPDVMHVVVRNNRGITKISDLAGRRIIIGSPKSGMRASAEILLKQYGLTGEFEEADSMYFDALKSDDSIDGAIITSGVQNGDLRDILNTGKFSLLPVTDASAMEITNPYFQEFVIPKGLYREQPPVPAEPVKTIATTAFLVAHEDADNLLVAEILASIYEEGLRLKIPALYSRKEAQKWLFLPMHPVSRSYFDPQDEIGQMAAVMESLAATKELLFALAAGIYLLWERWRRLKKKEELDELRVQRDRLDELLTRTVGIESQQIGEMNAEVLRRMLDDVTRIKLQALVELSHEALRGDRSFLIFLTQCSNLISKIQAKIATNQAGRLRPAYLTAFGLAAGGALCLLQGRKRSHTDADGE